MAQITAKGRGFLPFCLTLCHREQRGMADYNHSSDRKFRRVPRPERERERERENTIPIKKYRSPEKDSDTNLNFPNASIIYSR